MWSRVVWSKDGKVLKKGDFRGRVIGKHEFFCYEFDAKK